MPKKSTIDYMAERVSKLGGCEVIVHRLVDPNKDRIGRQKVGMYQIEVRRGRNRMTFGDFKVAHAKRTLAMIADMIQLGFISQDYPTEDAYMRACRALNWRHGQLRAHGIEPIRLPDEAEHYPPDDFDFNQAETDEILAKNKDKSGGK